MATFVLGEMPRVTCEVTSWKSSHQLGGSWESDDGWMAGDDSHTATVPHGGVRLVVWSPLFHWQGREEVGQRIDIPGSLDRAKVEAEVRTVVKDAAKRWNLGAEGNAHATRLIDHIMTFVPEFRNVCGMILVDEDEWRINQLITGIPHGFTVVVTNVELDYDLRRHYTPTRVVRVVEPGYAGKYGIPGKLAEGEVVVYWPEGQADTIDPNVLAEQIRETVGSGFGSEAADWYRFAAPETKETAEKILTRIGQIQAWERIYRVQEAQAFLTELEGLRPELIRLQARAQAGEILVNVDWGRRRQGGAGNCDGWVVRPDGTHRDPDKVGDERHTRRIFWRIVEADELALLWQGGYTGEVAKLPVGGCTKEQLDAVTAIEQELGLNPNAFGLNAEAEDKQAKLVTAIVTACGNSGMIASAHRLEISYHAVTSGNGQMLESGFVRGDLKSLRQKLDQAGTTLAEIQGRFGRLAKAMNVAGGCLQFIVFNKYGRENLAIRWLPAFEAMIFGALSTSDILIRVPYISDEVLRSATGFLTDETSFLYEVDLASLIDPAKGFKYVVNGFDGAKEPAQVLEAFRGDTGTLFVLAYGKPGRKMKLCIRWRDSKPA